MLFPFNVTTYRALMRMARRQRQGRTAYFIVGTVGYIVG